MSGKRAPRYLIYGLVDPRDSLIHYIGKSSNGLTRPRQHGTTYSLRNHSNKNTWIRSLLDQALTYVIVILDSTNDPKRPSDLCWWHARFRSTEHNQLERWWIAYGHACGWPLTNTSEGGEGFTGARNPEVQARARAARQTPEFRERMRVLATGRQHTEETKRLMSAIKTGTRHTLETRLKMSAAHAGKKINKRAPSPMKGKHHTEESKAKISAAKTGHKQSPETCQKRSASMKAFGENHHMKRPEVRAKTSATRKMTSARKGFIWVMVRGMSRDPNHVPKRKRKRSETRSQTRKRTNARKKLMRALLQMAAARSK